MSINMNFKESTKNGFLDCFFKQAPNTKWWNPMLRSEDIKYMVIIYHINNFGWDMTTQNHTLR